MSLNIKLKNKSYLGGQKAFLQGRHHLKRMKKRMSVSVSWACDRRSLSYPGYEIFSKFSFLLLKWVPGKNTFWKLIFWNKKYGMHISYQSFWIHTPPMRHFHTLPSCHFNLYKTSVTFEKNPESQLYDSVAKRKVFNRLVPKTYSKFNISLTLYKGTLVHRSVNVSVINIIYMYL